MLTNFPPMELGETLKGKDDEGNLVNNDKLGLPYVFPFKSYSSDLRGNKSIITAKPIVAVCLRNTSGLTLLGKRLGQLDRTAGHAMNHNVDGYSTVLANKGVVLIDPYLPSGGVADDDIFWGIIRGPAEVLVPMAGAGMTGDIVVNAPLVGATGTTTGATTSGRVSNITLPGQTGATEAFNYAYACIGRAMSARTTHETTAGVAVLVDFAIRYW